MAFPPIQILRGQEPPQTSGHRDHKRPHRDKLSQTFTGDDGRGLSYTPYLLLKPAPHFWQHRPQIQVCFPAASNALAPSGGNGIFTATQTERITHYTLQAKSCAKGGRCPLWIPRTTKQAEHPALSLCSMFSLYLLSAAPFRGLHVVPCKLT